MDDVLVSCIVPVYNGKRYIRQCILSILGQTFRHFELIIIDDGSTDGSSEIIDEYADADSRIRIHHQDNSGVSAARNKGISLAQGEWITFIDCDDWIEPDYLEQMNVFVNDGYDFIACSQYYFNKTDKALTVYDGKITSFSRESDLQGLLGSCIIRSYSYPHLFMPKFKYGPIFTGPWCKYYRRELLLKHEIQFDADLRIGEDSLFNLNYLLVCNSGVFINKPLYHYRIIDNSLFHDPATKLKYWPVYFQKVSAILYDNGIQYFLDLKIMIEIDLLLQRIQSEKNKLVLFKQIKRFCRNPYCKKAIHAVRYDDLPRRRIKTALFLLKTNNYPLLYLLYRTVFLL